MRASKSTCSLGGASAARAHMYLHGRKEQARCPSLTWRSARGLSGLSRGERTLAAAPSNSSGAPTLSVEHLHTVHETSTLVSAGAASNTIPELGKKKARSESRCTSIRLPQHHLVARRPRDANLQYVDDEQARSGAARRPSRRPRCAARRTLGSTGGFGSARSLPACALEAAPL